MTIEPENPGLGPVEPWWVADEPDPAELEAAARRLEERQREIRDSFTDEYGFVPVAIGPDGKPRPRQGVRAGLERRLRDLLEFDSV